MANEGWVRLWRKSLDSGKLQNPAVWVFWCYCLMKASHKRCKVMVGYQPVTLEPGQFIFGRKQAAKDLPLSEQTIRTCTRFLLNDGSIIVNPTNKFTIISIVNWELYQSIEDPANQQLTSSQPTTNQQVTTNKNVKNVKNVKNKTNTARARVYIKPFLGTFHNVKLTQQDLDNLKSKFINGGAESRIETLSNYIASKGDKYKSHYATILNWDRMKKENTNDWKTRFLNSD